MPQTSRADEESRPLTDRQRLFVEKYCTCFNATQAAREAGYSAKTARQIGQQNLSKLVIRAEIERLLATHAMGRNEVLARLSDHARGDMGLFVKVQGEGDQAKLVPDLAGALQRGDMRLVKKIKIDAGGAITIELYDAQKALTALAYAYRLIGARSEGEGDDWDDEPEPQEQPDQEVGDDELMVEAALAEASKG